MTPRSPAPIVASTAGKAEAPLLPPRPNRGPEPWPRPDDPGFRGPGVWVLLMTVALVPVGLVLWARRFRGRRRPARGSIEGLVGLPHGRREVAVADLVRSALVVRWGPAWAARTTEEVAGSTELAAALGPDRLTQLVAVLAAADLAKFAPDLVDRPPPEGEPPLTDLLDALAGLPEPEPKPAGGRQPSGGRPT